MVSGEAGLSERSLAFIVTAVLAIVVPAGTASAQTYLYGQADLATGNGPMGVATADFNGDGRPDLAVANNGDNTVSIILGQANGTFSAKTDFPTGASPSVIIAADFNGDGKLDLATVSFYSDIVSVLLGNGDGTFQNHVDYATGAEPANIVAADFNGDGKLDLAAVNRTGGTVSLFIGNGDGTFQQQSVIATGGSLQWGTVGDFNGDGKPDLVLAGAVGGSNDIIVLLNSGKATFTQVTTAVSFSPEAIAVGDFNGDGKLDIAVSNLESSEFSVLLGNGDGTFQTPGGGYGAPAEISFILAADVNHDGKLDLVTSGFAVFLGNGDGTFQQPLISAIPSFLVFPPSQLAVTADFNGDGVTDLGGVIDTGFGYEPINFALVLLGKGNGTFASQSTLPLQSSDSVGPSIVADFDGDSKPDIAIVQNNNTSLGSVSVLLGNGNGTFQSAISSPLTSDAAIAMVSGDFNADGKTDVALLDFDNAKISVLFGKGDGSFQASVDSTLPSGMVPNALTAGDFNNDGKSDLAVGAYNPSSPATNFIEILLSNGDGTFNASPLNSSFSTTPEEVAADFNKDGKLDLAVTAGTQLEVFLGHGDGTFGNPIVQSSGSWVLDSPLVAADFNGDGKIDIAASSTQGLSVDAVVFLGNGDGTFQSPLTSVLGSSGGFASPAADFNGDGKLDLLVMGIGPALGNGNGTFQQALPIASLGASAVGDFNSDGVADVASATPPTPFQGPFVSLVLSTPAADLYPASLTFSSQGVGTSSPPQTVTLANAGNSKLSLSSIETSGDFAESNSCGSSLAIGADCAINLTFTPSATGTRSGTASITDNNNGTAGSIQTVTLTGTGTGPVASLSPSILPAFASENVGTTSSAQKLTLSNTGNAALTINSIAISGTNGSDFSQSNGCGDSVAAGANCTITVTFKPTASGSRTATLTVTDNSNGKTDSTQTVSLSGTGVAPEVTLAPGTVSFGAENVGTASSASTVTLTNSGNASLTISATAISGSDAKDFAIQSSSTCSTKTAVAAGKNCSVSLLFTPSAAGARSATLTITDNANDASAGTQTVALSGTGKSFSLAPASGSTLSATVNPGASANYTLALSPQSGFDEAVQATCTEPASLTEAACTLSPASLTLSGSSATNVAVTVTTTAASFVPLAKRFKPPAGPMSSLPISASLGAFAALGLLGLLGLACRRRAYGLLALTALLVLLWGSCGGGGGSTGSGNPGTPAGTYNIVVSVTGGNVTQSATLNLTVQ